MEVDSKALQEVHRSVQQLEMELTEISEDRKQSAKVRSLKAEEEEVLQTQTISLDVVRQNLEEWTPAFKTEVDSILSTGAMEVISDEKYRKLLQEHPDLERLPMLAVCGNHSSKQLQPGEPDPSVGDPSVGGIDTVAIRCILNLAAQRDLEVGSLDVKGAFLQAPRRSLKMRPTVCDPPQLIKLMGILRPKCCTDSLRVLQTGRLFATMEVTGCTFNKLEPVTVRRTVVTLLSTWMISSLQ